MTNERKNNEADELVSRTYRELADERTPEHLDSHVLGMAAKPGNSETPKNPLLRLWTKPLAWAATIGLCLAIVLELTQVEEGPETYQAAPMSSAPEMIGPEIIDDEERAASVSDEFIPQDAGIFQEAEDLASMRAGPNLQQADVAGDDRDSPPAIDLPAPIPAGAQPSSSPRSDSEQRDKRAFAFSPASPVSSSDAVNDRTASIALDLKTSDVEKEELDTIDACPPMSRKTADDWSKCIGELRESGKIEDADREYEAFVLDYPDLLPNR